jgi:hypothetical protein
MSMKLAPILVWLLGTALAASELRLTDPPFPISPDSGSYVWGAQPLRQRDGRFAILSQLESNEGGSGRVELTRFDRDGRQIDRRPLPIPLSVRSVASHADGSFAVITESFAAPSRWRLTRFDERGDLSSERSILSDVPVASNPSLAAAIDGSFLLVWQEWAPDAYRVRARRLDHRGEPVGPRFDVSIEPASAGALPAVVATTSGYFVVWGEYLADNTESRLRARVFGFDGSPRTAPFAVQAPDAFSPLGHHVAADPDGDVLVGWTATIPDGSHELKMFWRGFRPDGTPRGAERHYGSHVRYSPGTVVAGRGRFVATWIEGEFGETVRFVVRELDGSARPLSDDLLLHSIPTFGHHFSEVSVVALGGNELVASWLIVDDDSILLSASGQRALLIENGACVPASDRLCLVDRRFDVRVDWRDFAGRTGSGSASTLSAESGLFSFFDPGNLELLVKVIDACDGFDHFWFFAGATTNVEYTLSVTDRESGRSRIYFNPLGTRAAAIADDQAFDCP